GLDLAEGCLHHEWIASHGVLIKSPDRLCRLWTSIVAGELIIEKAAWACRTRRNRAVYEAGSRFAIGDHHDLLHLFTLGLQNPAGQPQAFCSVRVVRTNLRRRQLSQR